MGGISNDIESSYNIAVDKRAVDITLFGSTLKEVRKMYTSYSESIEMILETVRRFSVPAGDPGGSPASDTPQKK